MREPCSSLRVSAWPGAVVTHTNGRQTGMEETADEIRRLQDCINDLISVPPFCSVEGQESAQIIVRCSTCW
jgi:hypothetical protein